MKIKTYSNISQIPAGSAPEGIVDGCLVLEGGAFRGLYTQGFLDALMQSGLNLRCVVGVSAGALSGLNYVAGQIGRSARINLGYRHDSRYVGSKAFLHNRSILDIGFLVEDRGVLEPFDEERFFGSAQSFVAVTTNCLTGKPSYFEKSTCTDIMQAVKASASMPYISPMVSIDGTPHLDGGCSCKIPYRWALEQGFEKIVVVRTREAFYRKEPVEHPSALQTYRHYPKFAQALFRSNFDYNRQCDEVERLHAEGRLMRFAPSKPVEVSRLEGDMEKLGELYWLGYTDCANAIDDLSAYLGA